MFRDAGGEVLYIGKAKSLRSRVRSYFQAGRPATRIGPLTERIADLEVIVTDTEVEALHLEQNLVKRHRPPFNVRLRDDKSFPYIAVTVEDEYPRVMFTRERHRPRRRLLRPVREREEGARDARRPQPRLPVPALRGAEAGAALRHPVPRLPHRALPGAMRGVRVEGGLPEGDRRRDRVPLRRHAPDRAPARGADEACGRRRALRGGGALPEPAVRGAPPRRAAGGRQGGRRDDRRDRHRKRGRPRRRPGLPAPGREADRPLQLPPRERRGQDTATILEAFFSSTTAPRRACLRRSWCRATSGDTAPLAEFLTERRGSRVEVRAAERGEKRRLQELATQNARLALESEASAAEQKRLRRVEALEELREALNLESLPLRIECYDISNIQESDAGRLDGRLPGRGGEEGALPEVRDQGRGGPGRLRGARRGGLAPFRPDAGRRRRGVRRVVRLDAEPRPRRRRQGPALGCAGRDAGLRPAAGGGGLAREARRGGLRAGPGGADRARPRTRRASSSCSGSATRRTASRSASTGSGATRRRRSRSSTRSQGVGPVRRRALLQHFGSAERFLAASQEELEGVPGCRRRRRARSTRSCTRQAAREERGERNEFVTQLTHFALDKNRCRDSDRCQGRSVRRVFETSSPQGRPR